MKSSETVTTCTDVVQMSPLRYVCCCSVSYKQASISVPYIDLYFYNFHDCKTYSYV